MINHLNNAVILKTAERINFFVKHRFCHISIMVGQAKHF